MRRVSLIQLTFILLGLTSVCLVGCNSIDDPANAQLIPDVGAFIPDAGQVSDIGPVEPPAPSVRISTFNVRKFFDTRCDTRMCSSDSFEYEYPEGEFFAKAQQVANGIRLLNSDVVLLQELESNESMSALMMYLEQDDYPVQVLGETGSQASLDVAVVGQGTVIQQVSHYDRELMRPRGGTTSFSREFLELHLEIEGRRVIVFNAHFKAKTRDDPDRRLAEAQAARDIVRQAAEAYPDALIVLGGDLNDTPGSRPIEALEAGGGMLRVAEELGSGDATYTFRGQAQAIDHLYLVETPGGRYVNGTAEVIRSNQRGLAGSDHAGLVAEFIFVGP